ncbi:MAG: FxsA family protein [bacterium]
MPLLILFIVVPMVEIYFLIKVGSVIGAFPTLLIVIGTAILGSWLLRQQGMATMMRYQKSILQGKLPAQEMIEGVALVIGGILLLTPGFVTDIIGFLCLVPVTRQGIVRWVMSKVKFQSMGGGMGRGFGGFQQGGRPGGEDGRTFDAEFERTDNKDKDRLPPDDRW